METSKIGQHLPIKIFPPKMLPTEASLPPLHYQHDTLIDIIKSLRHPEKQNRPNNLNYICFPGFSATVSSCQTIRLTIGFLTSIQRIIGKMNSLSFRGYYSPLPSGMHCNILICTFFGVGKSAYRGEMLLTL
jgi:hypothetical protein